MLEFILGYFLGVLMYDLFSDLRLIKVVINMFGGKNGKK